jgi:hypothetical protein
MRSRSDRRVVVPRSARQVEAGADGYDAGGRFPRGPAGEVGPSRIYRLKLRVPDYCHHIVSIPRQTREQPYVIRVLPEGEEPFEAHVLCCDVVPKLNAVLWGCRVLKHRRRKPQWWRHRF